MKITFLGAAQTVTGSCYMIEAAGARFCVDCGMHQGNSATESRNYDTDLYQPERLDFVLLTHAHIDHSGLLPRMAAHGFNGPIFCTAPTKDLVSLMLEDSAHIQETEAAWKASHQKRKGNKNQNGEMLYNMQDAKKAAAQLRPVQFDEPVEVHPGVKVNYRYAGHILGAAFLELEIMEDGKALTLAFSGDLGRPKALLLNAPETPHKLDYIFMESTYGDRDHKGESDTLTELAEAVAYSYGNGKKVIIPTFAVERTQEILYSLMLLHDQGKIPADMPIYVDSPLAIRATQVFLKYSKMLNTPEKGSLEAINDPKYRIRYTESSTESQAINDYKGPAIVLSASGMCNAGRIKHHLKHNAWEPGASIVFVGYQAVGTPGRAMVDGAKFIRPFGQEIAVNAKIFTINGFSAHAGQSQLLDWVGAGVHPGLRVVLIHGEDKALKTLSGLIDERYHLPVSIPGYLEEMTLHPGTQPEVHAQMPEKAFPSVNWDFWKKEMESRMDLVRARMESGTSLSWEKQVALQDRLKELDHIMLSIFTDI